MANSDKKFQLKMELFGNGSPGAPLPDFQDWICRFNNWIALQEAQRLATQKFPAEIYCRSLLQHLGPEAHHCINEFFANNCLDALKTDTDMLCASLSTIFAKSSNCHIAHQRFLLREQHPNEMTTAFAFALRSLVRSCDFGEMEGTFLAHQFQMGCYQQKTSSHCTSVKSDISVQCNFRLGSTPELVPAVSEQIEPISDTSLASCSVQTESVSLSFAGIMFYANTQH